MDFMCLDFVNSWFYDDKAQVVDKLAETVWLDAFFSRWAQPALSLSEPMLTELQTFRGGLYQAFAQLCSGEGLSDESLSLLNSALAAGRAEEQLCMERGQYRLKTLPQCSPLDWLRYQLAQSFTQLLLHHDITLLKHCGNPDCVWFLFDSSKNRSRKWCCNTCASLMKVRRFRADKKRVGESS